ncbi:MAG: hypothetical protein LQ338_006227 [Usnochroma carphineum]|nr:MAG: hypothetical protein LQ338_006227 [Usnochroma carphineum]
MFASNQLICDDCFGQDKASCKSHDPSCANGLRDLAWDGNVSRWDRAAAHFARDADISDLTCRFESNTCSAPPNCEACDGTGAWAVLKSIVTLHGEMEVVWKAIGEARDNLMPQMDTFSRTFAPIPSIKDESLFLTILTAVGGGLLGFIPGAGGIVAGTLAGVGSGVILEEMFFGQPAPSDTASYLGTFTNVTQSTYQKVAEILFRDGHYEWKSDDGSNSTTFDIPTMMANGSLMQQHGDPNDFLSALVPTYERILLQQLVAYTWSNHEKDGHSHIAFIAFDNAPCDNVNPDDNGSLEKRFFYHLKDLDVKVTYEDKCYYLLDAIPKFTGYEGSWNCGVDPLPGGTRKNLEDQSSIFSGLSLEDFIIPSVRGWQDNSNQNDYPLASHNAQLVADPRDAAAINIPVCDYLGNPDKPGTKCPNFEVSLGPGRDRCQSFDVSTGANQPGRYKPGQCHVHIEQFQRNEKDLNPLNSYQLAVTIVDNSNVQVGVATKQPATRPLEIVDASLPYDLIVAPGSGDNDPLEFWYSDQYWKSDSKENDCSMGGYDKGSRKGDCRFDCPYPSSDIPKSATIDNQLPSPPTPAIGGPSSYSNAFIKTHPTPTGQPANPTPTYATGECSFHLRQWQKNEGPDKNPTNEYEIEVTIADSKGNIIGASGKVPAPDDKPVSVNGLVKPLTITAETVDKDPLTVSYDGQQFDTYSDHCTPKQKQLHSYDSGHRDLDCHFSC